VSDRHGQVNRRGHCRVVADKDCLDEDASTEAREQCARGLAKSEQGRRDGGNPLIDPFRVDPSQRTNQDPEHPGQGQDEHDQTQNAGQSRPEQRGAERAR
jgi:hypothetical protein